MSKLDGRGFVPADFDRDGDLDLFVFNNVQPAVYLRNDVGSARAWCTIQLRGHGGEGSANSYGLGAKVRITTDDGKTQFREMRLGSGYLSGSPLEVHFGLGDATAITALEVVWPGRTEPQRISRDGLVLGRVLRITQDRDEVEDVTPAAAR